MHKFDAFAEEVLGKDAWAILKKSVAENVRPALAPRIVLGWVRATHSDDERMDDKGAIKYAAELCVALDCSPALVKMSDTAGARLGKAVDDLIRRRKKVVGDLKAAPLEKVDEPGKAAAPWGPAEPSAPAPQKKKQNGVAKPVPPPKLTRSEAVSYRQLQQPCWRCGYPQLVGGELRGCLCTARMIKSEPVFFGARGPEMVLIGEASIVSEILSTIPVT